MATSKTFARGRSVLSTCGSCGRKHRHEQAHVCEQCWELAGYDNMINDEGLTADTVPANTFSHIEELLAAITEKGGDAERALKGNDYVEDVLILHRAAQVAPTVEVVEVVADPVADADPIKAIGEMLAEEGNVLAREANAEVMFLALRLEEVALELRKLHARLTTGADAKLGGVRKADEIVRDLRRAEGLVNVTATANKIAAKANAQNARDAKILSARDTLLAALKG